MDLGLKGKVALVAGASQGMGRASALGFLRQTNGTNSAEATRVSAQFKYAITMENRAVTITAWRGVSGSGREASRSSQR